MNTKTRKSTNNYATKKDTYAARLETIRRKQIRKIKTADLGSVAK